MTENSKPIERKLLYQTIEFSVGEDGMLCNPYNKPLRDIIYDIAKEFSRKTQECEGWKETAKQYAKNEEYYRNKSDQLKAENEKLKNEIEACYNQVNDFDIIATSKSNKLKQAEQKLERIEEYCKEQNLKAVYTTCKVLEIIDEVK